MQIQQDVSLKGLNTFGFDVKAKFFCEVTSIDDLQLLRLQPEFSLPKLILGGGSNILLTKDFNGLVVLISLKGIVLKPRDSKHRIVSAMAGENWHDLVLWTLRKGLGGIENLSLIPGNAGTAPMQNIGAYGREIKDVFHCLEAFNLESGKIETFTAEDCQFGYRESVFKKSKKGAYVILELSLELTLENYHVLSMNYGAIKEELKNLDKDPDINSVSEAITNIRTSKLPNPKVIGNAGSFFKNPVIPKNKMDLLLKEFPEIVNYRLADNTYKLAAGWLIEKAGWKGYRDENYGVHKNQALVLVNYGGAQGNQIEVLSETIKKSIFRIFAVELEIEVNII